MCRTRRAVRTENGKMVCGRCYFLLEHMNRKSSGGVIKSLLFSYNSVNTYLDYVINSWYLLDRLYIELSNEMSSILYMSPLQLIIKDNINEVSNKVSKIVKFYSR